MLSYKGGEKKIVVPSGAPIVRYEIGDRSDLKPGAAFTILSAVKKSDGTFQTNRVNVGRDGAVPQ
jgi:phage-related baseplate assembly protein